MADRTTDWDRAFHSLCRFEQQAKPILASLTSPSDDQERA